MVNFVMCTVPYFFLIKKSDIGPEVQKPEFHSQLSE